MEWLAANYRPKRKRLLGVNSRIGKTKRRLKKKHKRAKKT
jgi:hypothetical protein